MEERVGGALEDGQSLTVLGRMLEPGDAAPDFALDHFTGTSMDTVRLAGSVVVLRDRRRRPGRPRPVRARPDARPDYAAAVAAASAR